MSTPSGATTAAPALEGPATAPVEAVPSLADPMYLVGEVAQLLSISVATLYILIGRRDESGVLVLPSVKVGNARRIRKSDLDAYIASLEPTAPRRKTAASA